MSTLKCKCNLCSGHIEFDSSETGQTVSCPHCGADTLLYAPQTAPVPSTIPTHKGDLERAEKETVRLRRSERRRFLRELRAYSSYSTLRWVVDICLFIAWLTLVCVPTLVWLLATFSSAGEKLDATIGTTGVFLVRIVVTAWAVLATVLLVAARQAIVLLIDIADSNLAVAQAHKQR